MFGYPRSSTFTSIIGKCAILKLLSHYEELRQDLSHYEELRQDLAKNTQIWCSWKILHVILVYSCLFSGTSKNILAES